MNTMSAMYRIIRLYRVTRLYRIIQRFFDITIASGLALLVLNGCGGFDTPGEVKMFSEQVIPVLQQDCGGGACHAASDSRFATLNPSYFVFPVDSAGKISGSDRISKAYQRSKQKLASAGAKFASLVRKPLDISLGGLPHRAAAQYRTMDDGGLKTLMRWADLAKPADEGPLPPLVQRYADEIQPIMVEKRCMLSSCHGASSANLLKFDPGVSGVFDRNATLFNYDKVNLHLNLETPDGMLSRLIRKAIPHDQGGIFHRGLNNFFDPANDDPDLRTILDFVAAARTELGDDDKGIVTGLVFAATDATERGIFDISVWQPGGDIYSLVPATPGGTVSNLTARHHTGEGDTVDIRDPAVSYDGTRIAFAMRLNQTNDCLNLYVMDIDGNNLQQITNDSGISCNGNTAVANVEPLWGPDERIYFVSTRTGTLSASGNYPLSNVWRADPATGELLRISFSAGNEISPAWRFFPAKGRERPEIRTLDLTFTAARKVGDKMLGALMRVPPDFRADYHPHFGVQNPIYQIFTSMTQLPDLREPLILMDESNRWEGGALAIIDRNLGPIIADGGEPAVVNYVDPLQKLTAIGEEIEHTGTSLNGYYRDPMAMPDGTIVVSYYSASFNQSAGTPPVPVNSAIYRLTLRDRLPNKVSIIRKEKLVNLNDAIGVAKIVTDPKPIFIRRREEIGEPTEHLSNDTDSGDMLNFDLAVSLVVANEDSPSNTKDFDALAEKISYVRLVEEVARTQSMGSIGAGNHSMRRIIGEFPATPDRSVYVKIPAGVPFFIQALDDNRMAVATFNQWFFVLPGERLNQVTRREVWNTRCSACHGSTHGFKSETVAAPDLLTEASRVDANYDASTRTDLPPTSYGIEPADRLEIIFGDIQQILADNCAINGCHNGTTAPNLSNASYNNTLTNQRNDPVSGNDYFYVDPFSSSARTSYFAEVLIGQDLDSPRDYDTAQAGHVQNAQNTTLSQDDLETLIRWMDLGANLLGDAPDDKPELPTY